MCPTCLNFVFNFSNVATAGDDPILEFTIASFIDPVAADYVAGTGTLAPTQALMTIDGVLNFSYDGNTGRFPWRKLGHPRGVYRPDHLQLGGLTFQDGATATIPASSPHPTPPSPRNPAR